MTASTKPGRQVLDQLTGIRALATYLVFVHHYNPFPAGSPWTWAHAVGAELHVGVSIFFVLSGFLICDRYYDEAIEHTPGWIRVYMWNRIARIYPLYFILTAVAFLMLPNRSPASPAVSYFANITFLRGFFDKLKYTGIAPGWSLTVEVCFYLLAPVLFLMAKKRRLFGTFLGLLGVGFVLVLVFRTHSAWGLFGSFRFMLLYTFFGRGLEFYTGMRLALWWRIARDRERPARAWKTTAGGVWVTLCIMVFAVLKGSEDYGLFTPWGIVVNNLVLPGGVALLFSGLLTEETWLKRILSTRVLVLLGKASYAFYLVHMGVLAHLVGHFTTSKLLLFIAANVVAVALYKLVESPLHGFIKRWAAPREDIHPAAAM